MHVEVIPDDFVGEVAFIEGLTSLPAAEGRGGTGAWGWGLGGQTDARAFEMVTGKASVAYDWHRLMARTPPRVDRLSGTLDRNCR